MRTARFSVHLRRGSAYWGVCPGGCTPPLPPAHCMLGYTPPPWTEWLTNRCKNFTFPQLRLRMVNIMDILAIFCSFLALVHLC